MGFFSESEQEKAARLEKETRAREQQRIAEEDRRREIDTINKIIISTGSINKDHNIMQVIFSVTSERFAGGFFTGSVKLDSHMVEGMYSQVIQSIKESAYKVGADAVINTNFSIEQVAVPDGKDKMALIVTVFCTGTAVHFI